MCVVKVEFTSFKKQYFMSTSLSRSLLGESDEGAGEGENMEADEEEKPASAESAGIVNCTY
jgi:hypothetical protein